MRGLEVKVVLVGVRMKAQLLEGGGLLLFLEILVPFVHLVEQPAEVVELAYRWLGVWLYFNQILIALFGYPLGVNGVHHLLCSVRKNNADLWNTNLLIDSIGEFWLLSRNLSCIQVLFR